MLSPSTPLKIPSFGNSWVAERILYRGSDVPKAKSLFSGHYHLHLQTNSVFMICICPRPGEVHAGLAQNMTLKPSGIGINGLLAERILGRSFRSIFGSSKADLPLFLAWTNES